MQRPRDSVAAVVAALAVLAILVNALFMQRGPHPAPIFAHKPQREAAAAVPPPAAAPRAQPAEPVAASTVRTRHDTIAEIQRELSRRGFYDGTADGIHGPKTDTAIRDFEQAARLRSSAEPNDALLAAIRKSDVKAKPATAGRNDPIAQLLSVDRRLIGVQRALAEFGYGPIKPTGVYDAETKAAIERFERARKRPVTGQVSPQLLRDLSTLTGRPLE
ncbi:MAG: peptidoglycan-binding protein [Alphaproteobacteria bacterium]|nr:peptidoglycan-binding protein [Alphaproteobacteria bacterium]